MSSAFEPGISSQRMSAPGGEGSIPRPGPTVRAGSEEEPLGRALEALFDPGSGDDVVAVAEAELRLQRPLLVPELVEALAQTLELSSRGWVVPLREDVPQLG